MLGALVHFLHSAVAKKIVEGREEGPYTRPHTSHAFVFRARDGQSLIIHLSAPPKFWEGLCEAVGRPDLTADSRFADRSGRRENYWALRDELLPAFQTGARDEWLQVLQGHNVPCAPVNTIGEALDDPQLRHLGIIDSLAEDDVGVMPRIRPPIHIDGSPLPSVARAPFLGEHTEVVLTEVRHHTDTSS